MKPSANNVVVAVALMSICVSLLAYFKRSGGDDATAKQKVERASQPPSALPTNDGEPDARIRQRLERLEAALGSSPQGDAEAESETAAPSIDDRLTSLEASIAKLQSAFNGISLESASEERDELFRGEDGHLKADEYFAAGKFAIAGEGYLKFLEANPDHPDAFNILGRARNSFKRAGYMDKAIWAQEELIKNAGQPRSQDLSTLANLEKMNGQYEEAAQHVDEAADMLEGSDRLWKRLYWAWYTQLGEGNDAGVTAYREVEKEIIASGYRDHRLGEQVRKKIAEIERLQSVSR